jgi:hypothetical protein
MSALVTSNSHFVRHVYIGRYQCNVGVRFMSCIFHSNKIDEKYLLLHTCDIKLKDVIQMNHHDLDFNNIPSKLRVYDYDTLSSGILKVLLTKSISS